MTICYDYYVYPHKYKINKLEYRSRKVLERYLKEYLYLGVFSGEYEESLLKYHSDLNLRDINHIVKYVKAINRILKQKYGDLIEINSSFRILLESDYYFRKYFKWFKKFLFSFLYINSLEHFHAECSYDLDFEDFNVRNIEIKILLPFEDFNDVLDFMEFFLKDQEIAINEYLTNFEYKEELMKYFKRSNFIFRSLYESD